MRREDEIWPDERDLRKAFFHGAKWWEYHSAHATMWQSDQNAAAEEAERRYPNGHTRKESITDVLQVYVPTLTAPIRAIVVPGSAIVSRGIVDTGSVLIYYEGNVYDAVNMRKFSERVLHAAGRLTLKYPTRAKAFVSPEDLVPIGEYWTTPPRLAIRDYLLLEEWLTCGRSRSSSSR